MSKSYTLMFTLNIPSSGPFLGTYSAGGQIVIDITNPSSNTKLPEREIKVTGDINMINAFPPNTKFLIISYDGPQISYYDNSGIPVDLSNPLNISKVTKVVAGISTSPPPSSDSSSSNVGLILGIVFGLLILGGIGVGAYFYMAKSTPATVEETKNLEPPTRGYFTKGE